MSLQNDAYGRTVVLTSSDGTTDYYLVGGSITYTFPTGTPTPAVYLSIVIQWNAVLFQNALRAYIQNLYDPSTVQLPLALQYLAARKGQMLDRAAYIAQLFDWLNAINIYATSYRTALLAMVSPATVVATAFDPTQISVADPGVTIVQAIITPSTPRDPSTAVPSTPSRVLNTPFQPSTTNAVMVFYTISIACTSTILASQTGLVQLKSDASATPTTVRSRASNTLGGVAASNTEECVLCYLVPAGHFVNLVSSGAATIAITAQTEVTLVST